MEQAILNLEHLSKSFDGKKILDDLSINIGKNEYSPKFLCKSFISLQPLTFPFPIDKIIMDRIKNHKKSHKLLWSFYGQSMPL